MDVTTFEYQTAMMDLRECENEGVSNALSVINGIWFKANYIIVWGWVAFIVFFGSIIFAIVGGVVWNENANNW